MEPLNTRLAQQYGVQVALPPEHPPVPTGGHGWNARGAPVTARPSRLGGQAAARGTRQRQAGTTRRPHRAAAVVRQGHRGRRGPALYV